MLTAYNEFKASQVTLREPGVFDCLVMTDLKRLVQGAHQAVMVVLNNRPPQRNACDSTPPTNPLQTAAALAQARRTSGHLVWRL